MHPSTSQSNRSSGLARTLAVVLAVWLGGCKKVEQATSPVPPPTYTGPAFLHGTVGSMTRLRGSGPQLVSGYGLVVNLQGTGSAEVPAFLRQWLINEMRKRGVGSAALGTGQMTPERMLASLDTAVVQVQGLIPPGATKGTRFDVLVTSLPQTQTTSLLGGRLWTVDLVQGAGDRSLQYRHKLGQASGPLYINPFDESTPQERKLQIQRQAVVLSGGVATTSRQLELLLNQPSWQRSRLIADRINERFPKAPYDKWDTASAVNDVYITLNIPERYSTNPETLLELIGHLFTQRAPGFEQTKAQQLADLLLAQPRYGPDVLLAWVAMGKIVLPVIRPLYNHADPQITLTALEAGARMEDEATVEHLSRLAQQGDVQSRRRVARMLVNLPSSIRGSNLLQGLLDDHDQSVRVAAYESLVTVNDPSIHRMAIDGPDAERFKFVLDLVPARRPLVYIAHQRLPRLVIFNPTLGFRTPFLATLWGNRLMVRGAGESIAVFSQKPGQVDGRTAEIPATAAEFIYLLAHKPTMSQPAEGLDLTYSEVASAVYQLCQQGTIPSDTHLQINPIAQAIADAQQAATDEPRPETDKDQGVYEPVGGSAQSRPEDWDALGPGDSAATDDEPVPPPLFFP